MSLFEKMEDLVRRGFLYGVSERIDGIATANLYRDIITSEYMLLCCDVVTRGESRTCSNCHMYGPVLSEMALMEKRHGFYTKKYPKELCLATMKQDFQQYVSAKCSGDYLLYSTFLDNLREWDVRYIKFCFMDYREVFIRTARKSVYLAARQMEWGESFLVYDVEGFSTLTDEEREIKIWTETKESMDAETEGLNLIVMRIY